MQKPHTDKKFYELGVKEADHNMRLLWSDAPESAYAATEAEEVASLDGNMVRVGRHVHVFESEQLAKVAYESFVKGFLAKVAYESFVKGFNDSIASNL